MWTATALAAALSMLPAQTGATRAADKLQPADYLPPDTETVVRIDVRQVLDSPLGRKHIVPALREWVDGDRDLKTFLAIAGLDPIRDIEQMTMGFPGKTDTAKGLIVLRGNFNPFRLKFALALAAATQEDAVRVVLVPKADDDNYELCKVVLKDLSQPYFVFVADARTIFVAPREEYITEALGALAAKKKVALKSKEMTALLERLDPKQGVSMGLVGSALDHPLLTGIRNVEGVDALADDAVLRIRMDKEVEIELKALGKDEKKAKHLDQLLTDTLDGVKGVAFLFLAKEKAYKPLLDIIKSLHTTRKATTIRISMEIPGDVIDGVIAASKK